MKRVALIFGVTGQDGSYLAEFLLKKKYIVYGVIRRSSSPNTHRIDHILKIIKNFEFFFTKNSKKYYFKLLEKEMCQIYGYPKDSINYFLKLFPISEILKFNQGKCLNLQK